MPQSLEDRIEKPAAKLPIWDFMVSAYSSSKAVKLGLLTAASGYSYSVALAISGAFYLGAKTAGAFVKYVGRIITNPLKYLSPKSIKNSFYETLESYNPFGKYKRPTFMGATLSTATHFTGF